MTIVSKEEGFVSIDEDLKNFTRPKGQALVGPDHPYVIIETEVIMLVKELLLANGGKIVKDVLEHCNLELEIRVMEKK